MPGRLGPRFAIEALFLIALAVGAAYADLERKWIALVMAVGWLVVALLELAADRIWAAAPPWRRPNYMAAPSPSAEARVGAPAPPPGPRRPGGAAGGGGWGRAPARGGASPAGARAARAWAQAPLVSQEAGGAGGADPSARAAEARPPAASLRADGPDGRGSHRDLRHDRARGAQPPVRGSLSVIRSLIDRRRADEHPPTPLPEPEQPAPEPAPPAPEPQPPTPEAAEPTPQLHSYAPREWNLWELERLANDGVAGRAPTEEVGFLLLALRQFANAEGRLPASFDPIIRESFGDLVYSVG